MIYKISPNPSFPKRGREAGIISIDMFRFLCLIFISVFLACSSEKPAEPPLKPSAAAMPAIKYSIEIMPRDAYKDSTFFLISNFNIADAKIEWLINNNPAAGATSNQFKATDFKKGDIVQAKAIIKGKEILSNIVKIKNTPPEISYVKIMPEIFKPGDTLYVNAKGRDADGDDVALLYEWTKNGEPAGTDKKIEGPIKRGDKIDIRITPFDGEDYGRSITLHREIVNMPPMIVEYKTLSFEGDVYTCQVKAVDPDDDPLVYSLKKAPEGMAIDKSTGLIKWDVPPDFEGKGSFTVSVTDGHGGEAVQDFLCDVGR